MFDLFRRFSAATVDPQPTLGTNFDQFWTTGRVRIRAKVADPFAGLRGHDYIAARQLGCLPLNRLFTREAAEGRIETEKNLADAINRFAKAKTGRTTFVFASGSKHLGNGNTSRRFSVVKGSLR